MRVLVTSSRNTFALDLIRKLGSVGHTVFASDTYDGAVGNHSRFLAGHLATPSPRFIASGKKQLNPPSRTYCSPRMRVQRDC